MSNLSADKLAKESERLRTDQPFAQAVMAIRNDAVAQLASAEQEAIAALLANKNTDEAKSRIVQAQANITAIDMLCTAIAHQILRGTPRETKPVA